MNDIVNEYICTVTLNHSVHVSPIHKIDTNIMSQHKHTELLQIYIQTGNAQCTAATNKTNRTSLTSLL